MLKILNIFTKQTKSFRRQFAKQLLKLVTSAFGLVAALAWNEVVKQAVTTYIKPIAGESSNVIYLLVYALIVTILAVLVTYYLTLVVKGNDD